MHISFSLHFQFFYTLTKNIHQTENYIFVSSLKINSPLECHFQYGRNIFFVFLVSFIHTWGTLFIQKNYFEFEIKIFIIVFIKNKRSQLFQQCTKNIENNKLKYYLLVMVRNKINLMVSFMKHFFKCSVNSALVE